MELDEWTGFQFDSAVAMKYYLQEEEADISKLDVIMDGISSICKGLGMKVSKKKRKSISGKDEIQPIGIVLAEHGGPGIVIEKSKKKT